MEEDEYLASLEGLAGKVVVVTGYEHNLLQQYPS
jgi:hypothetical protein